MNLTMCFTRARGARAPANACTNIFDPVGCDRSSLSLDILEVEPNDEDDRERNAVERERRNSASEHRLRFRRAISGI